MKDIKSVTYNFILVIMLKKFVVTNHYDKILTFI